jgi:hypothetical protein
MDNVTETGFYYGYTMINSKQKTISTFIIIKHSPEWIVQVQYIPSTNSKMYIRSRYNGTTWGEWVEIAQLVDIPTKLSQLTNDANDVGYLKSLPAHNHDTLYMKKGPLIWNDLKGV